MSTHFIGIGGAGMSVIAELLLARGEAVQGSDARDSEVLDRLRARGARVFVGQAAEQVDGADLVVISTAVRESNPELAAARERGIPVIHRSQALARAAAAHPFVAVAGAHGKTTTSGMLAVALTAAGADPSYAIGGHVIGGSGAHLGTGPFVAEADESDGSFLNYAPRVALVTNIEPDHLDHYGSAEAVTAAFVEFSRRIVPGGLLVVCEDDPGSRALGDAAAAAGVRVRRYGRSEAADVRLADVALTGTGSTGTIRTPAGATAIELAVPGAHNLLNAVGAWCVGVELGVEPGAMAAALGQFRGTGRRFEPRGEVGGVRVVDDYAHHPTEVAALLRTARLAAGSGRVLVLFQPHLYSRTLAFAAEFADALALADLAVLTDIYAAREDPREDVTSALVTDRLPGALFVPDAHEAARAIAGLARPGDLVLTVGAGDVTALGPVILEALAAGTPR